MKRKNVNKIAKLKKVPSQIFVKFFDYMNVIISPVRLGYRANDQHFVRIKQRDKREKNYLTLSFVFQ